MEGLHSDSIPIHEDLNQDLGQKKLKVIESEHQESDSGTDKGVDCCID